MAKFRNQFADRMHLSTLGIWIDPDEEVELPDDAPPSLLEPISSGSPKTKSSPPPSPETPPTTTTESGAKSVTPEGETGNATAI